MVYIYDHHARAIKSLGPFYSWPYVDNVGYKSAQKSQITEYRMTALQKQSTSVKREIIFQVLTMFYGAWHPGANSRQSTSR